MFPVSAEVMRTVPPLALEWLSYVVAMAVLGFLVWWRRLGWRLPAPVLARAALAGMAGYGMAIAAQYTGTRQAGPQLGALITAITPALIIVGARLSLHEPVTARKALAVCLAVAGILLVVGLGPLAGPQLEGAGWLLLTAGLWAYVSLQMKRLSVHADPLVLTLYGVIAGWAAITAPAAGELGSVAVITAATAGGIFYLGAVATAAAYYLWNRGLAGVGAGQGGLYLVLQPLTGALISAIWLHAPVTPGLALGGLLVAASLVLGAEGDAPARGGGLA